MGTHFRDLLPDVWQPSPQSVHRAGKEEGDQPDRVAEPVTQDRSPKTAVAGRSQLRNKASRKSLRRLRVPVRCAQHRTRSRGRTTLPTALKVPPPHNSRTRVGR